MRNDIGAAKALSLVTTRHRKGETMYTRKIRITPKIQVQLQVITKAKEAK